MNQSTYMEYPETFTQKSILIVRKLPSTLKEKYLPATRASQKIERFWPPTHGMFGGIPICL